MMYSGLVLEIATCYAFFGFIWEMLYLYYSRNEFIDFLFAHDLDSRGSSYTDDLRYVWISNVMNYYAQVVESF